MTPLVSNVNNVLAVFTVLAQVLIVVLVLLKIFNKSNNLLVRFFADNALSIALLVALSGTLSSLFYSEVGGFEPCMLCWYQRIFLYPQVVILGIAWARDDWAAKKYALSLSIIGALIAAFQYYEQITQSEILLCSGTAQAVSCSESYITSFGYITIPLMSLTGFVLIIVLMFLNRRNNV